MSGEEPLGAWRVLSMRLPMPFSVRGTLQRWLGVRRAGNWREVIRASGLPAGASAVCADVVRRSRLWRGERAEVARELCGHFRAGLQAGRSEAELIQDFGEPRAAARLIRRAKKRQRGWVWQAWRRWWQAIGVGMLAGILVYAALVVRYFTGRPSVRTDYLAMLNAPAVAVPESERAWPVYRRALLTLEPVPMSLMETSDDGIWPEFKRGSGKWDEMVAYLERNKASLDLVRQAAAMPRLGYVATDVEDVELLKARSPSATPSARPAQQHPPLFTVLLPNLGYQRELARALAADARVGAAAGDGERVASDLMAMLGLAEHAREQPVLIAELVSWAILALDLQLIGEVLDTSPALLTDAQLVALSHRLTGFSGGQIRPEFAGERMFFADVVQRVYTDDGCGGGRVTPQGMKLLGRLSSWSGDPATVDTAERVAQAAANPVAAAIMAGRREAMEVYDRMICRAESHAATPMWKWGDESADAELERMVRSGGIGRYQMFPLAVLVPALDKVGVDAQLMMQRRDGMLVAISLELYQRDHGGYPDSLAPLAPRYLPTVPPDRFDGAPLKYRLTDGRPVVYSVGVDRKDDGGRVPRTTDGRLDNLTVSTWRPRSYLAGVRPGWTVDGDWVLWPPVGNAPR